MSISIRAAALVVGLVSCISATSSPAYACSCAGTTLGRRLVLPSSGVLPTNGAIRIFLTGFPQALRKGLAAEYRLRDAKGRLITLRGHAVQTRLDLRPARPLQPRARYTLEQVFAFADSGERLTDTQRLRVALYGSTGYRRARTGMRRAWYPVARFTGGSAAAARKPKPARIASAHVSFAYGGGDCGPGSALWAKVSLPAGLRDGDALELEVRKRGVVDTVALTASQAGKTVGVYVSDKMCTPDKVSLGYSGPFDARVAIRSLAGSRSAVSGWFKPKVPAPIGRLRGAGTSRGGSARFRGAVIAWFGAPLVKPKRGKRPARPLGCRSLRVLERLAGGGGAADSYESVGSVGWRAARGWTLVYVRRKQQAALLELGARVPTSKVLAGAGYGPLGSADKRGFVVASSSWNRSTKRSHVIISAYDRRGRKRWRRELRAAVSQSRPRLAIGDGRVLVIWRTSRKILDQRLRWTLLDRSSGKIIASDGHGAKLTAAPRVSADLHYSVAFSKGRFFIAYDKRHARAPRIAIVDPRKRKLVIDMDLGLRASGNGYDIAAAPAGGAMLAYSHDGQIYWTRVDKDAQVVGKSVRLSLGSGGRNRKPRIARAGPLWAVGWEAYPGGATYVAAVDARGRATEPLSLAPGQRTSTVGLGPARGHASARFIASYVVRWSKARAALLACSKRDALGPPASL